MSLRSDLFSLGSVMHAMCTGRPPFRAETSYRILRRITDTEPRPIREVNPNIPAWLEHIIQRLHTKSLDDRIQAAEQIAALLQKCLAHLQQPTLVELREECRLPVVRASRLSFRSWRVRTMMILTECLAVFGIYAASYPKPDQLEANPVSESDSSTGSDEPTPAWDSMLSKIEDFEKGLQPAEAEIETLWGTKKASLSES